MINKKKLLDEIVEFLFRCEVFSDPLTKEETSNIERGLAEPKFVEELIGIVMNYVRYSENMNYKEVKALYLKLNDIRFDLEYGMNGK